MKKKIFIGLFMLVVLFGLTGCGNGETYKLGGVVESDILKLTLNKAQFAIALENTNGEEYATPKEYDADGDENNPYVAAKGHTYVAFTFTVENLDRSSVEFGGSFNDDFASVKYNGKKYTEEVIFKAEAENILDWKSYDSSNVLLLTGETMMYRAYIDIPVDVENLDDTFELTFYLPTSNGGTQEFTFVVTKEDRDNLADEEIPFEVALTHFTHKKGIAYFTNHYQEYEVVSSSELENVILSKKYNVQMATSGSWIGTFKFEESGRIYENSSNGYAVGYVNNRTWKIEGDKIIISSNPSGKNVKSYTCEMRKIEDGIYLLINDGTPILLMK